MRYKQHLGNGVGGEGGIWWVGEVKAKECVIIVDCAGGREEQKKKLEAWIRLDYKDEVRIWYDIDAVM